MRLKFKKKFCVPFDKSCLVSMYELIKIEDVYKVRFYLKNCKAPGPIDDIPGEFYKFAGSFMDRCLCSLFRQALIDIDVYKYWGVGTIINLFKKGDKSLSNNYRSITLSCVIGKNFTLILQNKIVEYCEINNILSIGQNGFRPKRSCSQHIFSLFETCSRIQKDGKTPLLFFLDLRKAFDTIPRNLIYERLSYIGIPSNIIMCIRLMHSFTRCNVKTNNTFSDYFDNFSGVAQGSPISPILFDIIIDVMLKKK